MRLALVVCLLLVAAACEPDVWTGYFYHDRSNLTRSKALGSFATLEACRAAATALMHTGADYECGLNCKPLDGVNVCERTER